MISIGVETTGMETCSLGERLCSTLNTAGAVGIYSKEQSEVGGWKITKESIRGQGILAKQTSPGCSDITNPGRR